MQPENPYDGEVVLVEVETKKTGDSAKIRWLSLRAARKTDQLMKIPNDVWVEPTIRQQPVEYRAL